MRIHEREDLRLTFRKRPAAHAGVELTCRAQAILCRQCGKKTARRVGESANRSSAKTVQSKLPRQIGLRRLVHFLFQLVAESRHSEKYSLTSSELARDSKPNQLAATSQGHARPGEPTNVQAANSHLWVNQPVAFSDRSFGQGNELRLAGANFLRLRSLAAQHHVHADGKLPIAEDLRGFAQDEILCHEIRTRFMSALSDTRQMRHACAFCMFANDGAQIVLHLGGDCRPFVGSQELFHPIAGTRKGISFSRLLPGMKRTAVNDF